EVNVVFRVQDLPDFKGKKKEEKDTNLQHCCGSSNAALRGAFLRRVESLFFHVAC
ncbi:MAG: hypothetical protein K0R12_1411, partial [Gammaproteobacteria bacterium]|nr:hypothetical protein [Gammaproteobacteria bacterium]